MHTWWSPRHQLVGFSWEERCSPSRSSVSTPRKKRRNQQVGFGFLLSFYYLLGLSERFNTLLPKKTLSCFDDKGELMRRQSVFTKALPLLICPRERKWITNKSLNQCWKLQFKNDKTYLQFLFTTVLKALVWSKVSKTVKYCSIVPFFKGLSNTILEKKYHNISNTTIFSNNKENTPFPQTGPKRHPN